MAGAIDEILSKCFDYIVIGGGTSGLTIASRLSSDPLISVIVLEAGEAHNEDDPKIAYIGQSRLQLGDPKYDYAFRSVPQVHANGRQYMWSRGKGPGGTSAMNYQVWTLPPSHEVDAIEALGNPGWNWNEYVKYQTRVDKQRGLLPGMGLQENKYPYDGYKSGPFFVHYNVDPETWTRSYATNSYYIPVRDRPNLVVITKATVARVLFDGPNPGDSTAIGVEFIRNGTIYVTRSNKEVILSAGAIKTPQLLELSGIGRRDVLEKINVEIKVELPGVGENVQEHTAIDTAYEIVSEQSDDALGPLRNGGGSRSISNAAFIGIRPVSFLYAPLSITNPESAATVIEKVESEVERLKQSGTLPPGLAEQYDIQLSNLRDPEIPDCQMVFLPRLQSTQCPVSFEPGKEYFGLDYYSNHPFARGSIHARSSNPEEDPEIDPHYLEFNFDIEILLQHIAFGRKSITQEPLKSFVVKELYPGTDAQLRDFIKNCSWTSRHTVGSCSMLPRDKNGVVSPELIVYGTKNLRIVDLSIVPLSLSTHTQTVAHTIGEKAYDIILGL